VAALAASVALLAAIGCSTPTLPLPPPSALVEAPDAMGLVTVTGDVLPDAFVFCFNERTSQGVIVTADDTGRFSLQIGGQSGDDLSVWQRRGTDRGPDVSYTVP